MISLICFDNSTNSSDLLNAVWSTVCKSLYDHLLKFQSIEFGLIGKFFRKNDSQKSVVFVPSHELLDMGGFRLKHNEYNLMPH